MHNTLTILSLVASEGEGKSLFLSDFKKHLLDNYECSEEIINYKYDDIDFHSVIDLKNLRLAIYSKGDYKIDTCRAVDIAKNCNCNTLICACRDTVKYKFQDTIFYGYSVEEILFTKEKKESITERLLRHLSAGL